MSHGSIYLVAYKLSSELDSFSSAKNKKRVIEDPNQRFAEVEDIKKALEQAAGRERELRARQPEVEAKKAAESLWTDAMLESYCKYLKKLELNMEWWAGSSSEPLNSKALQGRLIE
ncbi:uncharacterized protein P174DRAFT_435469 [Aspergillus novofumigatus IBT 16806]|uniref:Uncharacterized protein n=1 Tax=Aspergillus novofumigatus (strain IBT 16806) TaxID=1392255 RepID=A0A2I1BVF5_ASPN1|nr:uncharacterized protein P174DRAFT_435469 [Aspergillus novofumigatus IBT 16806]PKX89367.1 hypothetical protein P174DRAFT_435469 [Aspergillus novofumigatus IBT 16806]